MNSHFNSIQNNKEELNKLGMKYTRRELREFVNSVYDYISKFADGWLLNGRGLELQYKDSQVAFKVIEKFLEADKTVLTIHDSFITKVEDQEFLYKTIEESYREVIGYIPTLKVN